ncbi:MAG: Unknown protein [uncultured Sulfurovum sp.]|uniref:Periplasmic protein n=1 Tax=uncultured Sulfurovum sp. TaxID=269237 RepID=A0A6S6SQ53_9BACT|nr:MAG: Unknown protein [uncultured Sulfurovum sp.]
MKKILFILLIVLISLSFFLFNDKGNEYLKPYLESYLETKLQRDMSVKIEHLNIDFRHLELDAVLNNLTKVKVAGDISLLSQSFDLDYKLTSNGFKNKQISFTNKIDINGTVIGTLNNMKIYGEGETLKSHINYALNIKDELINNIKVKINKADIASLLQLAAQPAYAEGKVDVDIDIPTFKEADTKGTGKITLYKTLLNEKTFKEALNIDLPKNTVLTANLNSKVSAEIFEVKGNIKSNLAWLKLNNTTYNVKDKKFIANYKLLAPRLSQLAFLTKQTLRGQLQVAGTLHLKDKHFFLKGSTKDLGGDTNFDYNGEKLNLSMEQVDIAKLLYMLHEQPYATGKLLAKVQIQDLNKLRGSYTLKTIKAKTIANTFKKDLNIDFGKDIAFSLDTKGVIASNLLHIENTLFSDIFQYRSANMVYNLNTQKLESFYTLEIPKLSELDTLAGKSLQGEVSINGEIQYDKNLTITGSTKSLGGSINFKLLKTVLSAKIDKVPVKNLMTVLSYPIIFEAPLVGDFYYDLVTRQGTLNSTLTQAQLLENSLTKLVKQIRGVDLTKERYNQTHFNAILNKNLINIDFKAKSKQALFAIPSGQINKSNNTINANYQIEVNNKDMGGKIQGNIAQPNISIDSSNYLQKKVNDVINSNISSDALKDLGLDKLEPEAIKNLLGDLFK